MSNGLNKLLISLSGIMSVILGVVGIKFEKESGQIANLKENLRSSLVSAEKVENMIDLQSKLEAERSENIKKVGEAVIGTKTETKTKTTVIPGKTVSQSSAKASSSKSTPSKSSSTSTSSASKSSTSTASVAPKPAPKPAPAPAPAKTTKTS